MLGSGDYGTPGRAGRRQADQPIPVCGILRLTLLAADIVERVLDGRPSSDLAQLMKPFLGRAGETG
jgi:hypothetical protein